MSQSSAIISFRDVFLKYLHIADNDYNGHVNDNVLNIFNDLNEDERKLFLRGVVHIHSLVVGDVDTLPKREIVKAKRIEEREAIEKSDIDAEDEMMEFFNKRHKLKMKMWFIKMVGMGLMGFLLLFFMATILSKNEIYVPFLDSFIQTGKVLNKVLGVM